MKKMFSFNQKEGFSLMELLIYIGILGISAGVIVGIVTTVTRTQVEESVGSDITGQIGFAMQTIQRLVKDSSLIEMENSTNTTSTVRLRMQSLSLDPTIIYLSGGKVYVSQGTSAAQPITNEKVVVDFLDFKKFSQYPGKDTLQIDLVMSGSNKFEGKTISRTLRSAVSRVSAATFDDNVIPGIDNSYSLGNSGSKWTNGYFTGDVSLSGASSLVTLTGSSSKIGIGTNSPSSKLDIVGDGMNVQSIITSYGTGYNSTYVMRKARGSAASPTAVQSGDTIGIVGWRGYGSSTFPSINSSKIQVVAGENWTDSAQGSYLSFYTTATTTTSSLERLRILENGNLMLGSSTPVYRITNVASPVSSSDVATKGYVDAASSLTNVLRQAFFYTTGTATFSTTTRGTSVTTVYVTMCGAGGGGGGGGSVGTECSGGGGGGAGSCYIRYPLTISTSTNYTITTGAGGSGAAICWDYAPLGTCAGSAGSNGGASSFGALLTADYGRGGTAGGASAPGSGGAGGTPYGGTGGSGLYYSVEEPDGGDGGGNIYHPGAKGGSVPYVASSAYCEGGGTTVSGSPGQLGSGGGGGGGAIDDNAEHTIRYGSGGGKGGDGFVLVEWFE